MWHSCSLYRPKRPMSHTYLSARRTRHTSRRTPRAAAHARARTLRRIRGGRGVTHDGRAGAAPRVCAAAHEPRARRGAGTRVCRLRDLRPRTEGLALPLRCARRGPGGRTPAGSCTSISTRPRCALSFRVFCSLALMSLCGWYHIARIRGTFGADVSVEDIPLGFLAWYRDQLSQYNTVRVVVSS